MLFVYGLLTATAAIITAELVFNYGLGDKLKDIFLSAESRIKSLEGKLAAMKAKKV